MRLTVKKRMRATLLAIRDELTFQCHEPIRVQGQLLTMVVSGYFKYHAVPGNLISMGGRSAACRPGPQALKRRRQRNRLKRTCCGSLADLYIPRPRSAHPTLSIVLRHIPEAGAVCGSSVRTDMCGAAGDSGPYRATWLMKNTARLIMLFFALSNRTQLTGGDELRV